MRKTSEKKVCWWGCINGNHKWKLNSSHNNMHRCSKAVTVVTIRRSHRNIPVIAAMNLFSVAAVYVILLYNKFVNGQIETVSIDPPPIDNSTPDVDPDSGQVLITEPPEVVKSIDGIKYGTLPPDPTKPTPKPVVPIPKPVLPQPKPVVPRPPPLPKPVPKPTPIAVKVTLPTPPPLGCPEISRRFADELVYTDSFFGYAAKGLTVGDCQPVGNSFFYRLTQKGNFGTAREFCTRGGGDLATINNEAEFNAFAKVMHSMPMADKLPSLLWGWVWIGLNCQTKLGDWRWIKDNRTPIYTRWGVGEPNNFGGTERCVAGMESVPGEKPFWNDINCYAVSVPLQPICRMQ